MSATETEQLALTPTSSSDNSDMDTPPAKRRHVDKFPPLDVRHDVEAFNVEGSTDFDRPAVQVPVPRTKSQAWGTIEQAAARALLTEKVTEENEELLRTYHPAFTDTADNDVYLLCVGGVGRTMWLIRSSSNIPYARAAGLPIHYTPNLYKYRSVISVGLRRGAVFHRLDPKRLLSDDLLNDLRILFPRSCGVRLWLSETVEILYPNEAAIRKDEDEELPITIGSTQQIAISVLDCRPSHKINTSLVGQVLVTSPDQKKNVACLGLPLRLPDNTPAITTVTHAFVRLPGYSLLERPFNFIRTSTDAIRRFRTPRKNIAELPYIDGASTTTSNTSLGKPVWMALGHKFVGNVTHTFDNPSHLWPYPAGYQHDLSLVTKPTDSTGALPRLSYPPGHPVIDGWGSLTDALSGKPVFVYSTINSAETPDIKYGHCLGPSEQSDLPAFAIRAITEGAQYLWDPSCLKQSVSVIWRTVPDPASLHGLDPHTQEQMKSLPKTLEGQSGSIFCLGEPSDATVKALAFQNFELSVPYEPDREKLYNIKGGFILPSYIYKECQLDVDCSASDRDKTKFATEPRRQARGFARQRNLTSP